MKKYSCFIFFISISFFAQTKGVVKDSITGKPIPYVNIWVENQNIGTTSEEDGSFVIKSSNENHNLIFSAIGFDKKKIKTSDSKEVFLSPKLIDIEEVVVFKRFETKVIEIGKPQNSIYQAFDNGPKIDVKYFPYFPKYKKTKYIKKVSVETDSNIDLATIKIHFYKVTDDNAPGEEMLSKNFIVSVKKGVIKNSFDVTDFNLKMPHNGIFVGVEKLLIQKNKFEKTTLDPITNQSSTKTIFYPYILYNFEERAFSFTFTGGKWIRNQNKESNSTEKTMVFEPAINLILTN